MTLDHPTKSKDGVLVLFSLSSHAAMRLQVTCLGVLSLYLLFNPRIWRHMKRSNFRKAAGAIIPTCATRSTEELRLRHGVKNGDGLWSIVCLTNRQPQPRISHPISDDICDISGTCHRNTQSCQMLSAGTNMDQHGPRNSSKNCLVCDERPSKTRCPPCQLSTWNRGILASCRGSTG